ncbi:hypothetical protein ACHAXT_000859 [Thalassiosira profunda]
MWSNLAHLQRPHPPEAQPQPDPEQVDDAADDINDENGDAWGDDIDLGDEPAADVLTDQPSVPGNSEGAGEVRGWGSSALQSFASTQHEPLSLTLDGPPPAAPESAPNLSAASGPIAIAASGSAPALEMEPKSEPGMEGPPAEEAGGWGDDDAFSDDTPQKETQAANPLGRMAESFGAALLASMDQEEEGYVEERSEQQPQPSQQQVVDDAAKGGALGRFGAALLASVDQEEEGYTDNVAAGNEAPRPEEDREGGFGGGFVMKGLSRFIEAATAPQEPEEGGWGDDDAIDLGEENGNDVAVAAGDEKKDSSFDEGTNVGDAAVEGHQVVEQPPTEGWDDDFDVSFGSPTPKADPPATAPNDSAGEDSAQLEMEPPPTEEGAVVATATEDDNVAEPSDAGGWDDVDITFNTPSPKALPKRAEESVDLGIQQEIAAAPEEEERDRQYSYEENKDDSPEPVGQTPPPAKKLPHQESWYINSMEGGMGGVVYGEDKLEGTTLPPRVPKGTVLPVNPSDIVSSTGSVLNCPSSVGMPLSEMPSSANSLRASENNSDADEDARPSEPLHHSELQCKCLELVMPLPGEDDKESLAEPGFGTKKLPDGTTVLVNYEMLLQNEATKRILLQRSFEALRARQQAAATTAQEQEAARDALGLQLASAQEEIASLNEMVLQLQDEKEHMIDEAQLFEAELSALKNDKEYLESEVESVQDMEKNLRKSESEVEVLRMDLAEAQRESSSLFEEKNLLWQERNQLTEKVEELMNAATSADETRAACSVESEELRNTVESLQQELLQKDSEIEQLNGERDALNGLAQQLEKKADDRLHHVLTKLQEATINAGAAETQAVASVEEREALSARVETLQQELLQRDDELEQLNEQLRSTVADHQSNSDASAEHERLLDDHARLQNDFSETKLALSTMQDENESLRATQREYDVQITELRAAVDSMDEEGSGEVDRLAAEVASLTYELGVKSSECEESASALATLQAKLSHVEAQLADTMSSSLPKEDGPSEAEQSLRAEIDALKQQLAELQGTCSYLEGQKSELESNVNDRAGTIESLGVQIRGLNARLAESANVGDELSQLQEAYRLLEGQLKSSAEERSSALQSSLDAKAAESTNLRGELSQVRKALDDKAQECQAIVTSCEELKTELLNVQSDREMIIARSQDDSNQAQAQISTLQSQVADLLKDHNSTMKNVEEQLTDSLRQNSTLDAQCEEFRIKLEDAEKERANVSQATSETMAKYAEQVSQLQSEKLELASALQAAQAESSGGDATVQQLQRSANAMKEEMESIAHRHQELMDKNHSLMQEKAEIAQSLEARASTAEQQTNLLRLELAKLQSSVDNAKKASADAKQTVATLNEQLQALKDANAQLEDKLFEASFETPETERLAAENASLREERDDLKEESLALSQRIDELASQTENNGAFTSVEKEALLARIHELEEELRAENLTELRDELTSIQEEREQLDLDNEELLVQLGLMQQDKLDNQAEIEVEVETLREQVAALQERCDQLQSALDESRALSSSPEQKDYVNALLDEKNALCQTISQLKDDNASLNAQVGDLTQKMEGLEQQNDGTVKTLQQKLGLLELKLADREEEVESAREELRSALDSKDEELSKLKAQCSSKEEELKNVSNKLDAASNEVGSFDSQIERLKDRHEDQYEEEKFCEEEDDDDDDSLQDLLAEAVLDSGDDYLRSQIVVLAQALERSELQRAHGLERIEKERESNSLSLRQLGESVKRFYATMRRGDAI